jgi:hypothetical protein
VVSTVKVAEPLRPTKFTNDTRNVYCEYLDRVSIGIVSVFDDCVFIVVSNALTAVVVVAFVCCSSH